MDMSKIIVLASIAAGYSIYYWLATREERKKKNDQTKLDMQRRALGIRPGVGANRAPQANRPVFAKRCPRGVCTNPGASCPRECVEEPRVTRLIDGRVIHEYDNVEVCFCPVGNIQEVKVDGRAWL